MRTNIVLDDELLREAQRYSRARTKRALIEEALRSFVDQKAGEHQRASYRDRLQRLRQKLQHVRLRESPSSILRADRART